MLSDFLEKDENVKLICMLICMNFESKLMELYFYDFKRVQLQKFQKSFHAYFTNYGEFCFAPFSRLMLPFLVQKA